MSCYYPTSTYTDKQVTDFCDNVTQMIKKIPKSYGITIRSNINAAIGNLTMENVTNSDFNLIGPHEGKFRNERGEIIRNLMYLRNLKSAATSFNNINKIDTWIHPAMRTRYQLNHLFILSQYFKLVSKAE